jgi:hypothetical protein
MLRLVHRADKPQTPSLLERINQQNREFWSQPEPNMIQRALAIDATRAASAYGELREREAATAEALKPLSDRERKRKDRQRKGMEKVADDSLDAVRRALQSLPSHITKCEAAAEWIAGVKDMPIDYDAILKKLTKLQFAKSQRERRAKKRHR